LIKLFCLSVVIISVLFASGIHTTAQNKPAPPDLSDHYGPNGFHNIYPIPDRGFGAFFRWRLGLFDKETPPIPSEEVPPYVPDIVSPDLNRIRHPDPDKIQVTWIGHSAFLIQVDGLNILTDPIFSERGSPVSFLGPKRQALPGVPFDSLPPIDAVIISHDHYDHLDAPTIKRLGNKPKFFVALKVADHLKKWGTTNLVELDWWDTSIFDQMRFTSVPVQHFSSRSPFGFNQTLWTGWIIETKHGKIFFAGDTGYSPLFKEISKKVGSIRLSLLPIGAYRPRWFMKPMHLDPAEAVLAHQDLRSEQSIAMHWGTFKQTDEPLGEPPLYLKKVLKEQGIDESKFIVMKFGETRVF
jgi:L-ascorbate metabolism protein UlaG (beta-lactamase superfamily)